MIFYGFAHSYDQYGDSAIYAPVAGLLLIHLGDYGRAVESIALTAHLRSATRNPRSTLEGHFDEFHENLKKLPKITFRRSLKQVDIEFLSERFGDDDDKEYKTSADKCNLAAGEVVDALQLLKKRIKPSDDFRLEQFLADAGELLSKKIDSSEEWAAIRKQAHEKHQAILATKNPWALLEINWRQYHPQAREILDDPFLWENANDLAPNGNDIGADLLADFWRWDKRNRTKSPLVFLDRLLAEWGIEPIDWSITDEDEVRRLQADQPISLRICSQAAIALAFAVIKMRATCPPDLARMGLNALTRTSISVKRSSLTDEIKAAWNEAIAKMRNKLESVPD